MRQKVVRKAVLFLASVALASVALGGVAAAEYQYFESDLSENTVVDVCNPDGPWSNRVATAIQRWNAVTPQGGPTLRDVTGTGEFCEVRVEEVSDEGGQSDFYARLVFTEHPDRLEISSRITELAAQQRLSVIRHELGHALGLAHVPANEYSCANSVMTTSMECQSVGVERRLGPGHYDVAELRKYWVEKNSTDEQGRLLSYPRKDKCWTNEDADGDGKCDRFGPPNVDPPQTMRAAQRAGATPVKAPPNLVN
jgi:hypothetical protein